jgi:hypothetical protein
LNKSIYFFLIPAQVSRDNYAHNALVLAEGLHELGWDIYANIDYWREYPDTESYLFRHDRSVHPSDCAINVLTYDWMHYINVIPYEIVENSKSIRVYLEDAGWLRTPGLDDRFRIFDLVLKSHFNSRTVYPSNYRPWSFGLSSRIIRETAGGLPYTLRRPALLVNFGATHSHQHELRNTFDRLVYPKLEPFLALDRTTNHPGQPPDDPYHHFMWEQTAGRHYPDYYERLRRTLACSCVGGQLMPSGPADWSVYHGAGKRIRLKKLLYDTVDQLSGRKSRWNQWESWRFWESLAAGCACLALDLKKYGVGLPVMPENWKHYVGFDLDRIEQDLERFLDSSETLCKVGLAGREWALRNYAPLPVTSHFAEICGS